ncbi:MAG: WhiB family transcriptional regulator [Acidimicrobiales bacterium]|jgi:WhiB family redox-sensing transcriptional regulator
MSIDGNEFTIDSLLQPRMVEVMMQSVVALPDLGDFVKRPGWQARAACRGQSISVFFPEETGFSLEARGICASCPVLVECLSFALADPSLKGLWAGTSERARGRMRVAMKLEAASVR